MVSNNITKIIVAVVLVLGLVSTVGIYMFRGGVASGTAGATGAIDVNGEIITDTLIAGAIKDIDDVAIAGVVVYGADKAMLADIRDNENPAVKDSDTTDANGDYEISLTPGTSYIMALGYDIGGELNDYYPEEKSLTIPNYDPTVYNFEKEFKTGTDFVLAKTGAFENLANNVSDVWGGDGAVEYTWDLNGASAAVAAKVYRITDDITNGWRIGPSRSDEVLRDVVIESEIDDKDLEANYEDLAFSVIFVPEGVQATIDSVNRKIDGDKIKFTGDIELASPAQIDIMIETEASGTFSDGTLLTTITMDDLFADDFYSSYADDYATAVEISITE